ncbi:JNK1/MAPK8-associated membrane protein-like [Bacillus rossius redtenbacheri]|uniref:JNK1/MAPK8-associated membrane protein-like n=1 Tax=Bacillus rossius redtenbacheri TaxID=93214 RepID=UPI002FDDF2FA
MMSDNITQYWKLVSPLCLHSDIIVVLTKIKNVSFVSDYSFPYIIIILSVLSNAAHFAFKLDQSMRFLVLSTVKEPRNLLILLGHWLLHAYGIVSITQLRDPVLHGSLLALVPLPAVFYVLTARYTDPSKVHAD